mmetsp:Transcript_45159/g.81601  ORF Transcript_45159/g.81601 Transcript_45159/m.81601 type:complete len:118 (+) Transcript_45159:97-450(+)
MVRIAATRSTLASQFDAVSLNYAVVNASWPNLQNVVERAQLQSRSQQQPHPARPRPLHQAAASLEKRRVLSADEPAAIAPEAGAPAKLYGHSTLHQIRCLVWKTQGAVVVVKRSRVR